MNLARLLKTDEAKPEAGFSSAGVVMELNGVHRVHEGPNGPLTTLQNVSFSVRSGEILCILGPSGCGKSTLLNMMAGLDTPTLGTVKLKGRTVTGPGADRVVIFQEAALFPWLTIAENVEFGLRIKGVSAGERRDRAITVLEMVHLKEFAGAYPHQLSGGMKQRAALARGLVLDPEILLMDEPFAALDAQTRDILHGEVQDIWKKTKKTIVLVTHNVREAACLGHRILLLTARPGRVKKEYTVDLPMPRAIEDSRVVEVTREVLHDLKEEVRPKPDSN
ncbi:MAG TPA: ABC transporter ATP-binding protein [Bdellovibrionales bacterium]|nr:ABC transporter ATP-binding protein [Bdellovibrionales bacterium]